LKLYNTIPLDEKNYRQHQALCNFNKTLKMINYLFACYYKLFSKTKDDAPVYASVLMISITICVWFLLIFGVLKNYDIYNAFSNPANKVFLVAIYFALLFILYRYYRKDRASKILKNFEEKSLFFKYFWSVITIIMLILPIVSTALLVNYHIK